MRYPSGRVGSGVAGTAAQHGRALLAMPSCLGTMDASPTGRRLSSAGHVPGHIVVDTPADQGTASAAQPYRRGDGRSQITGPLQRWVPPLAGRGAAGPSLHQLAAHAARPRGAR